MGRLAYDLGNAYLYAGPRLQNSSVLFQMLVFADQDLSHLQVEGLSFESLERTLAYIDGVMAPLPRACMARPDAEDIRKEFGWVADMLRLACRLGMARLQDGPVIPIGALPMQARTVLAAKLRALIGRHRELWQGRNRPGGLDDSTARLGRILLLLEG